MQVSSWNAHCTCQQEYVWSNPYTWRISCCRILFQNISTEIGCSKTKQTNLIQERDNPALEPLTREFRRLKNKKEVSLMGSNFKLSDLIRETAPIVPNGILTPYSNYIGSLTTPDCSEVTLTIIFWIFKIVCQIVHWINFLKPLQLSKSQLATFRQFSDPEGHNMSDNFRPTQLLNNRKVSFFGPKRDK